MRNLPSAAYIAVFGAAWTPSASADPVRCDHCHPAEYRQFAASVHAKLSCRECHGGAESYALQTAELATYLKADHHRPIFDHGAGFQGKVQRAAVPQACGECHADVARMNPFGLRTDQLAAYWTSGHGKALKERGENRVAVCTDCHGVHDVMKPSEPTSRTNPLNVPDTCGRCHADESLMAEFGLTAQILDEYRRSVHGDLLLARGDAGAPTCATCHGNHAATPPGFATVGSVCGQCHQGPATYFATSVHAGQTEHHGCVQCHGGGPDAHFHLIERITKPTGVMVRRYAHLLKTDPKPTPEAVAEAVHAEPRQIIHRALSSCMECHEEIEEDESLPKLFNLLAAIAAAERKYVETAHELDRVGQGVLLVENQRFEFEDAKTHLIALAPLQHSLDNELVGKKVEELNQVCDRVQAELAALETGLRWRYQALVPIWAFAGLFCTLLYVKYKRLRRQYVSPLPQEERYER
jgi:hypothetical protein